MIAEFAGKSSTLLAVLYIVENRVSKTQVSKGEAMNRAMKTIFGEWEKCTTVCKRFCNSRPLAKCAVLVAAFACSPFARGQSPSTGQTPLTLESPQEMQARISRLEAEVSELKAIVSRMQLRVVATDATPPATATVQPAPVNQPASKQDTLQPVLQPEDSKVLSFLRETTINVSLDGYYAYNFNDPVGRVNLLRAYDVLSNEFSLNQADVVFEHAPDAAAGRRWGGRLDLQFGQATDTLQGNPTNEPRPQIYRNIFGRTAPT